VKGGEKDISRKGMMRRHEDMPPGKEGAESMLSGETEETEGIPP
jgi:hypothetical protein